jgi:acyl-CoA reductase-like NAD-dependent aldehyde dehydrogenase
MVLRSYNPYTNETIRDFAETSIHECDGAIRKTLDSEHIWKELTLDQRAAALKPLPSLIRAKSAEIADTLVNEIGMPVKEALSSTQKTADRIELLIEQAKSCLQPQEIKLADNWVNIVSHHPLGLVGCIMPWNHPFSIPFWSIVPALMAGNGVVYKPSELTPSTGAVIDSLFASLALPENLMTTVYGEGSLGRHISAAPTIDMISFAGTIAIGQKIYQEASVNMKRLILENGGKDALIVGTVNNPEAAADGILMGSLRHAGQLCSSVRRVYILNDSYDAFVDILLNKIKQYKAGDPHDPATIVGPLKSRKQINILNELVESASLEGATVLTGGKETSNNIFPPTLLKDVTQSMRIIKKEHFGPLIPLVRVSSLAEAVRYAHDSEFGLNASLWHDDLPEAMALAEQLEVGTVTINSLPSTHTYCTWHGVKMSGLGNLLSAEGIRQFANRKNRRYHEP